MPPPPAEPLGTVAREWGRLGAIGFGGPPTQIVLLRQLCGGRRGWIPADEFEDAIAACNLLPGPSSTQLAIYCAGRVGGWPGALVGGAGFIVPGLAVIIALAALFLSSSPPGWVPAAGAGGGAAVAAVAVRAALDLAVPSWGRAAGAAAAALDRLRGGRRGRGRAGAVGGPPCRPGRVTIMGLSKSAPRITRTAGPALP